MRYQEFIEKVMKNINEQPNIEFTYGTPTIETMPVVPAGSSLKKKKRKERIQKDIRLKKFENPLAGKGFPYN